VRGAASRWVDFIATTRVTVIDTGLLDARNASTGNTTLDTIAAVAI